jgi:flagellar biosynthesis/type III secretory pathway protein FliH
MARRKRDDPTQAAQEQQQPYDSVLKLLLENQVVMERLTMFSSLFDEDPFIQQKKAEGLAKGLAEGLARGLAEGEAKGEVKGLQKAVVTSIKVWFPPLTELARQRVSRITKPDALDLLFEQITAAPDEATVRFLLDTLAA